tara:strand:- start:1312 stop:1824 length:513 start_codon:yes stop_codon:yes gene_type:complete
MIYDSNIDLSKDGTKNKDINFLAPNSFELVIDQLTYKNVEYLVKTAAIPAISVPIANYSSPQRSLGMIGDRIDYDPLTLEFIVDENLANYKEIHDWLVGQINNTDKDFQFKKQRDITLIILDSHNQPIQELLFASAFPTTLSTLEFDSSVTTIEYMTASVTFEYTYYKIL